VQFSLQGNKNRVNQALAAIRDGTENSSNVKVSVSPATVDPTLNTFTVVGWTSVSRNISNPYDLAFYPEGRQYSYQKTVRKSGLVGNL
jgi:acylphosphatase